MAIDLVKKIKVPSRELQGNTFSELIFEVGFCLEALASYQVANSYKKEVLFAKDDIERLNVINKYIVLSI